MLRNVATLEKTLAAAVKGRDEAIAALDDAQKREEDMRASFAAREKLFEEQLFSVAKALSGTFTGRYFIDVLLFLCSVGGIRSLIRVRILL